jgi:hypothetical protein
MILPVSSYITGKMNGFTDEQIIELRRGGASWDNKINVLAQTAVGIAANKGKVGTVAKSSTLQVTLKKT